ncbi:hypothetical protein V6Z12_D01G118200 [Gossypium hirsutum]
MDLDDNSRNLVQALTNGDPEKISTSRFSSLLASKDRDYLLSSTTQDDQQVKISDLEGKAIGLYFSANWYPPCRNFNEVLIGVYEQLKSNGSNFEIVFVSSDEDLSAFNSYRESMPWLSIPFSDLETKKALNRKFEVEGIPYLIILQPDGSTLHDGVELIYRYGIEAFPFTEEKLEELRREERIKHESQTLTNLLTNPGRDYLLDQTMARKVCYLSSPACRSFCPFTLTFARYPHPTIAFPFTSEARARPC